MANSADPDQMPHSVASDLGLHCLQKAYLPKNLGLLQYIFSLYIIEEQVVYTTHTLTAC